MFLVPEIFFAESEIERDMSRIQLKSLLLFESYVLVRCLFPRSYHYSFAQFVALSTALFQRRPAISRC
jgi:hypothetical protein